jgi:NAD(P)-dependent dehydrogenase (short-subunit alcohol dehydrogenase family)
MHTMTPGRITGPFTAGSTAAEVVAGVDLRDKRAIVTGGSSGLGIETARALASVGAEVTLAVRNPDAGARVGAEINDSLDGERVTVARLDLIELGSVRDFAQQWSSTPLHVLVNNAGSTALLRPLAGLRPIKDRQRPLRRRGHPTLRRRRNHHKRTAPRKHLDHRVRYLTDGVRESFRTNPTAEYKTPEQGAATSVFVATSPLLAASAPILRRLQPGGALPRRPRARRRRQASTHCRDRPITSRTV